MNISRIFAQAVVRRLAYLFVGLVAAFGVQAFSEAFAACPPTIGARQIAAGISVTYTTREQARLACESTGSPGIGGSSSGWHDRYETAGCVADEANKRFVLQWNHIGVWSSCEVYYGDINATKNTQATGWYYQVEALCSFDDPPLPSGHVQCGGADFSTCPYTVCSGGCGYDQPGGGLDGYVIDGTRWVTTTGWMPRGEDCSVGSTPGLGTPPTDNDGDGTSDGNDGSPNNPGSGGGGGEGGESQPEDGSSPCGGPGQPACEEDGSNQGSGKGNTSGGGGNCQTPPSSTGDAILAQIAYQAWATRCAVEAQGQGGSGAGPGEGDGDGEQPGWTKGNGPAVPEDTSGQDIDDASDWGIGLSADLLDTENIFGNSSCPALPSFSIMGYEIDTSTFSWWCTLISIMRAAILIMGAFTAIQILLRGF